MWMFGNDELDIDNTSLYYLSSSFLILFIVSDDGNKRSIQMAMGMRKTMWEKNLNVSVI